MERWAQAHVDEQRCSAIEVECGAEGRECIVRALENVDGLDAGGIFPAVDAELEELRKLGTNSATFDASF